MDEKRLDGLMRMMAHYRVLRLKYAPNDGTLTELEMHPSAFAPAAGLERLDTSTTDTTDRCVCGHSLHIEHNQMGCLLGCSNSLCAGEQEARA